jgi:hypothetical protein
VKSDDVTAKIANVTCSKCSESVVTHSCSPKTVVSDLKATDGTPKGDDKPDDCPK